MAWQLQSSLYHTWFRQYDPTQGRWMSVDPIAGSPDDPQSHDRYVNVRNDPINFVDPSGLNQMMPGFFLDTSESIGGGGWECFGFTMGDDYPTWHLFCFNVDPLSGVGASGGDKEFGGGQDPARKPPAPQPPPSKECLAALAQANKNDEALQRARNNWDAITAAAANHGIDAGLLAAIGVRETGFRNVPQRGGQGMGVFQIDRGFHPQAVSFAYDISRAAEYAASLLAQSFANYYGRGFDAGTSTALAVRDYNTGPAGAANLVRAEYLGYLNVGTTGNNYVTNVLAIAKFCF